MNTPARTSPTHAPQTQFADAERRTPDRRPAALPARRARRPDPFYAYDRDAIARRVAELRAALPPAIELHYAMKANPMPALVGHMARLVDGIDVASAGELQVALDAGADPRHVSFAGPGKRDAELRQAVAAGILVNVESSASSPRWPRPLPRSACRHASR